MAKNTIGHDETLLADKSGKPINGPKQPSPGHMKTELGPFSVAADRLPRLPEEQVKENPDKQSENAEQLMDDPKMKRMIDGMIGQVIGQKYKITNFLGAGQFGIVFKALHLDLRKYVVLKITIDMADEEAHKRFKREARSLARVLHENVVLITDYGKTEDGRLYFVMEYYDGEDLRSRLKRMGRLELEDAIEIMRQVLRGLAAVHSKDLTHRDLKPENIFLSRYTDKADMVKILDFGIAKPGVGQRDASNSEINVTKVNMISGTPAYMPPEQAANLFDHRSDIYAAGIIFYEMLCGRPPFDATHPVDILHMQIHDRVKPLSEARPDLCLPPEVDQVILKALDKDKNKRYQGAGEFEAALGAIPLTRVVPPTVVVKAAQAEPPAQLDGKTIKTPTMRVRKSGTIIAVALGAAAAIAAGTAVSLLSGRNVPPPQPKVMIVQRDASALRMASSAPAPDAAPIKEVKKKTCKISIITEPADAEVLIDKEKIGTTPFEADFSKGGRNIRFTIRKPGFEDESIDALPDENKEFHRKLVQKQNGKEIKKIGKKDRKPGKKDLDKIVPIPDSLK